MINLRAEKNRVHEYMMEMSRHAEMPFQYDKEVTAGLVNDWVKKKSRAIKFLANMKTWDGETGTASFTVENVKKARWVIVADELFQWFEFIIDKQVSAGTLTRDEGYDAKHSLHRVIAYSDHSGKVTDDMKSNAEAIGLKLHKGGKINREFRNALLRYLKGQLSEGGERVLMSALARVDECSTEVRKKETWLISPLPSYILSQSHGNSWSSCHSILEGGCHAGGTLSYCNDPSTMIAWKPRTNSEWFIKEKRVLVHLGKGNSLLACRCYPTYRDEDVTAVLEGLQVHYSELEFMTENSIFSFTVYEDGDSLAYPDFSYNKNQVLFLNYHLGKKEIDGFWGTQTTPIQKDKFRIGGTALCLNCGSELDSSDGEQYINCSSCTDIKIWCYGCDSRISRDEAYDIDGNYYCECCVSECADCGELVPNSRLLYENADGESICRYCSENYVVCGDCDTIIHIDEVDGRGLDDFLTLCSCCADERYSDEGDEVTPEQE